MPNPVLTKALDALMSRQDLSAEQTAAVLAEIMAGNASEVETSGILVALRTKGETIDELVGLATTMRAFATPVNTGRDDLIDTAGTGGGRPTFNVSTTAALIAAGHGCAVAKHGNRSATGLSGSADVLEALGVRIDLKPEAVARCINEVGFGFMFAPAHHGATRFVVPVRKELAVRTIFNFLGPLTNPAGAPRQVIGVSDPNFLETIAGALARLGAEQGAGSVERRRSGRDEHFGRNARRRGRRRRRAQLRASTPEDVGLAARRARGAHAAARRTSTRRRRGGSSPASAAPRATSPCSTRARRSTSPARSRASRQGVRAAEAAIDDGRAAAGAGEPGEPHPRVGPRMSVLDRIVDDTRDEVKRRKKLVPLKELKGQIEQREEGARPFSEALTRPGVSLIAEHKRRSPSAGAIREDMGVSDVVHGLRARRRRGAEHPHRAVSLRRVAGRPARGAHGRVGCRSCARTSSSTATSSTKPPRPAPTRSC